MWPSLFKSASVGLAQGIPYMVPAGSMVVGKAARI